jgi:hypothetical protein
VKDRSLKEEMREALRGDRERAEARRKAEEEGAYTGPAPPTLDLNAPTREWKLPQQSPAPPEEIEPEPDPEAEQELEPEAEPESQPESVPEPDSEPEPEPARAEEAEQQREPDPELEPAAEAEPEPRDEPPAEPQLDEPQREGLVARLRAFFGG